VIVTLNRTAKKQLARLAEPMRGRIAESINRLEHEPPEGDIKKLQGTEDAYRIRVGDYRILYKDKKTCLAVYKISPRGQVYKEN
jgi:mRNA interferase RelE/StbE